MDGIAIKAMVSELAPVVREYVEAETAPLLARIAALEAEKVTLAERCEALEEISKKPPEIDLAGVEKLIEVEIAKLPEPEPAKEIDREELATLVNEAVAALPPAEKGADGDHVTFAHVTEEGFLVLRFAQGKEMSVGKVRGADGDSGKDGKDGAGIVDGFVSREGHLIATLSDGTTRDFGEIVGKDGEPGKDGRDGFGFDDMDACVLDDDRTIELSFKRGEEEKAFTFKWPTPIDRGVYKASESYSTGDAVTWGGSLWIAQKETDAKPDTPDSGWRLAVKKGRDGKDARG